MNPVFTSGPIRERLQLAPMSPASDWTVVAAISLAAGLTLSGALGAEVIANTAVAGLAALTLGYFVASLAVLRADTNGKRMAKSLPSARLP